jgi:SNF2 family DNA or RNA helicase
MLYPYQVYTSQQMVELETKRYVQISPTTSLTTSIGILGGDAGIGKTAIVLQTIKNHKLFPTEENTVKRTIMHTVGNGSIISSTHRLQQCQTTLVIASGSIRAQWKHEQEHFFPELKCRVVENVRQLKKCNPFDYDIMILNMTSLVRLLELYKDIEWWRVVFDEADSFVPTQLRIFPYRFTWFVSATWGLLERFVHPTSRQRQHTDHFYRRCFMNIPLDKLVIQPNVQVNTLLPPVEYYVHLFQKSSYQFTNIVRDFVSSDVQRQIESDDIQGAMLALGGTVDSSHSIVDIVRNQIEDRIRTAKTTIQLIEHSSRSDPRRLQQWKERLLQEHRNMTEVNSRFAQCLQDACVICFEQPMTNPTLTKCHHVGCLSCLLQWWEHSKTCPVCRTPMNTSDLHTFSQTQHQQHEHKLENDVPKSLPISRTSSLQQLLDSLPDHAKIAIFAEHSGSFDSIDRFVRQADGSKYPRLKGSSSERRKLIQHLRTGTIRLLLLNSREDSAGIHLPELTDIILFHDMTDDIKTQAVGRGQRIGRQYPLHVHTYQQSSI